MNPELADRIRTFVSSLPGVVGFNILLKYEDRAEMMGKDFPLDEVAHVMSDMVRAAAVVPDDGGFHEPPLVN